MSVRGSEAAVDSWFRERGLPTLVPVRRWSGNLLVRTAPLIAFAAALTVGGAVVVRLYDWFYARIGDELLSDTADVLIALAMLVAIAAIPILAAWLVRRWLRRAAPARRTLAASAVVVVGFAGFGISSATTDDFSVGVHLSVGLLGVLLMFAVVWLGVGSLLGWTLKSAWRNLGAVRHMASLALPVILLLVIFAFFSAELWQLADNLSWSKIFVLAVVIGVICGGAVVPASRQAVRDSQERLTAAERRQLLTDTPVPFSDAGVAGSRELTRLQRFNLLLVMGVAQLTLGAIFAAMQAVILVAIGKVALPEVTQQAWLAHPPQPIVVGESTMPVTLNLLKTAVVLALIAALSFIVSAVSDAEYRRYFFDPMLADVRQALAAHDAAAESPSPAADPVGEDTAEDTAEGTAETGGDGASGSAPSAPAPEAGTEPR